MSASTVMSPLLARCAAASRRSLGVKPTTRPAAMMCTHTLSAALQGRVGSRTRLLALTWALPSPCCRLQGNLTQAIQPRCAAHRCMSTHS